MASDIKIGIRIDAKGGKATVTDLKNVGTHAEKVGKKAKAASVGVSRLGGSLGKLAATAASFVGATSIIAFATETADAATAANRYAEALGISIEQLSSFQSATARAGIDADKAGDILKDVAEKIGDAYANNGGEAVEALENLGIAIEDVAGLNPVEQLEKIAEGLGKIGTQGEKVQIAESLANDLTLLLPLLDGNSAKLREFMAEAQALGATITADEVAILAEMTGEARRLGQAWAGFRQDVATYTAPALTEVYKLLGDILGSNIELGESLVRDLRAVTDEFAGWAAVGEDAIGQVTALAIGLNEAFDQATDAAHQFNAAMLGLDPDAYGIAKLGEYVKFAGQSFLDLPKNLKVATAIIIGEVDILAAHISYGFDLITSYGKEAWAEIVAAAQEWFGSLKVSFSEVVSYIGGLLEGLVSRVQGALLLADSLTGVVPDELIVNVNNASAALGGLDAAIEQSNAATVGAIAATEQEIQTIRIQRGVIDDVRDAKIRSARAAIDGALAEHEAAETAAASTREWADESERIFKEMDSFNGVLETTGKVASGARPKVQALSKATGGGGSGSLNKAAKDAAQELKRLQGQLDSLVGQYLPATAAAQDFAEAQEILTRAIDGELIAVGEAEIILTKMREEMQGLSDVAKAEAGAFETVWENSVERLDDAFAGMWRDLFDGGQNTLDGLENLIKSWLAEMAHTLLTKQLVVSIGAEMGLTDVGTSAGSVLGGSGSNVLGSLGNLGSLFGGGLSAGAGAGSLLGAGVGASGAGSLTAASFAGNAGLIGSGTSASAGLGLTAALPYVGIAAAVGSVLAGVFGGDKTDPRAQFITQPTGRGGFEDNVFATSGALGLDFALGGKSHGVDAEEYRDTLEGFASVADAIGELVGESVSSAIEQGVAKSRELDGAAGLAIDGWSADKAFDYIFSELLDFGAETGDAIAVALERHVGDLEGSADEMAAAIGEAIVNVTALSDTAEALAGTALGTSLGIEDVARGIASLDAYVEGLGAVGEDTATTLTRLINQVEVLNEAATLTSTGLEGLSATALLGLGQGLADAAGGVGTLAANIQTYYEQFYSAEERQKLALEDATEIITEGLADFDIAIPATRNELRALVESLDLTHEGSQNLFASLMGLSGAFDFAFDSAEAAVAGWISTMTSVESVVGGVSDTIEDFGKTTRALYEENQKHANELFGQLQSETDPGQVTALVEQIVAEVSEGWNLLDDGQKQKLQEPMLAFLDSVTATAANVVTEGLSALGVEETGLNSFSEIMASVGAGMDTSATTYQEASATLATAAQVIAEASQRLMAAAQAIPGSLVVHVSEVG